MIEKQQQQPQPQPQPQTRQQRQQPQSWRSLTWPRFGFLNQTFLCWNAKAQRLLKQLDPTGDTPDVEIDLMDPKFQVGNWRKLNSEETGCVFLNITVYSLLGFSVERCFLIKQRDGYVLEFLARLGISNKPKYINIQLENIKCSQLH